MIELEGQVGEPLFGAGLVGHIQGRRSNSRALSARRHWPHWPASTIRRFPPRRWLRSQNCRRACAGRFKFAVRPQGWAQQLLQEVEQARIAEKDVSADYLRMIALHNDKGLNALVEKHWGKVGRKRRLTNWPASMASSFP